MHWKVKAHLLAVLSRMRGGTATYHFLQRRVGTNRLDADESIARCAEVLQLLRQGGVIGRGVAVEIGTGWRPFLPFVLYLSGFDRVITLDVNPWLDVKYA